MDEPAILAKAREYILLEEHDFFRRQIEILLEQRSLDELNDRFFTELAFGTGGLRGVIGGGYNRMNPYGVLERRRPGCSAARRGYYRRGARYTAPSPNVLQFSLEDGSLVTARPSGTEPKIKFYVSCRSRAGMSLEAAVAEVERKSGAIIAQVKKRIDEA
jgi:phosphomannomutase